MAQQGRPGLISQRVPTAKRGTPEDPLAGPPLVIGLDTLQRDPKAFAKAMALLRGPGYPLPRGLLTGNDTRDAQAFMRHVADNLLFIHDSLPAAIRDRSKLWYVGANRITRERAAQYGLSEEAVAGVYAALSPQKDWFMNVSLGDRVMNIHHEQTKPGSNRMPLGAEKDMRDPNNPQGGMISMQDTLNRLFTDIDEHGIDQFAHDKAMIAGRALADIEDPYLKAMWIRTYDEHYNVGPARGHYVVTPEGDFAGLKMNKDGKTISGTAWGSLKQIENAVRALESRGDRAVISNAMGDRHKVRNFYNNIYDPWSPHGDVTVDTHAVGAGMLLPVAGGDISVMHNLKTSPQSGGWGALGTVGAPGSALYGFRGTYGLYADAYRMAASERRLLPREMQSITWEGIRGLFPGEEKDAQLKAAAAALWQSGMSIDEIRARIVALGGGFRNPDWHGR